MAAYAWINTAPISSSHWVQAPDPKFMCTRLDYLFVSEARDAWIECAALVDGAGRGVEEFQFTEVTVELTEDFEESQLFGSEGLWRRRLPYDELVRLPIVKRLVAIETLQQARLHISCEESYWDKSSNQRANFDHNVRILVRVIDDQLRQHHRQIRRDPKKALRDFQALQEQQTETESVCEPLYVGSKICAKSYCHELHEDSARGADPDS